MVSYERDGTTFARLMRLIISLNRGGAAVSHQECRLRLGAAALMPTESLGTIVLLVKTFSRYAAFDLRRLHVAHVHGM
jgi:hypothetical protein